MESEFRSRPASQWVSGEIDPGWPHGHEARASPLCLHPAFCANPDRLNHGNADARTPGFERRGIFRGPPYPIDRPRVREDRRETALRAEQLGSRRTRTGGQENRTPLFHRLSIPHRHRVHKPRRDWLRQKLRPNEQRFWLNRRRRGPFGVGDGLNRRTQDRLALQQKIQRVVVLLFGVGLTMSRGTEFVILLQFAQDTELFAAMEALHAVSFIGGNGELEESGKAL
jgi:hypothetical protein